MISTFYLSAGTLFSIESLCTNFGQISDADRSQRLRAEFDCRGFPHDKVESKEPEWHRHCRAFRSVFIAVFAHVEIS